MTDHGTENIADELEDMGTRLYTLKHEFKPFQIF